MIQGLFVTLAALFSAWTLTACGSEADADSAATGGGGETTTQGGASGEAAAGATAAGQGGASGEAVAGATTGGQGGSSESAGGQGGSSESAGAGSMDTLPPAPPATAEEANMNCLKVCDAQVAQGCAVFGLELCQLVCATVVAPAAAPCRDRYNATELCQLKGDACGQVGCEAEVAAQVKDCMN